MLLAMVGIFPQPADKGPESDPPPAAPADPAPPAPDLPPEPGAPPDARAPAAPPVPALPVAEPPVAAPAVEAPAVAAPPVAAPAEPPVAGPAVAVPPVVAAPPPLLPPVADVPPDPCGVLPAAPGGPFESSDAEQPPSEDTMVNDKAITTERECFMRISSKGMSPYHCQAPPQIVVTPHRKNFPRWLSSTSTMSR